MLSSEEYTGGVGLLKWDKNAVNYLASRNNHVIISNGVFEVVQMGKVEMINVVKDKNYSKRKSEKYSSKRKYIQ